MKTYCGDASVNVTVDGRPLPLRLDLANHSPDGFGWGYGGSGPAQLALALLADHLGDDQQALELYQEFKWKFVAALAKGKRLEWTRTSADIDRALSEIRRERASRAELSPDEVPY